MSGNATRRDRHLGSQARVESRAVPKLSAYPPPALLQLGQDLELHLSRARVLRQLVDKVVQEIAECYPQAVVDDEVVQKVVEDPMPHSYKRPNTNHHANLVIPRQSPPETG